MACLTSPADSMIMADRNVVKFALKIATALRDNSSSTAMFFMQQAYPDDVDAPADQPSSDEILDNVITYAALALRP